MKEKDIEMKYEIFKEKAKDMIENLQIEDNYAGMSDQKR